MALQPYCDSDDENQMIVQPRPQIIQRHCVLVNPNNPNERLHIREQIVNQPPPQPQFNPMIMMMKMNQHMQQRDAEREEREQRERQQREREMQRREQQAREAERRYQQQIKQNQQQQREHQRELAKQEKRTKEQLDEQQRIFQREREEHRQDIAHQEQMRKDQLAEQQRIRREELAEQKDHHDQVLNIEKAKSLRNQIEQLQSQKEYISKQQLDPMKAQLAQIDLQIATEEKEISGMKLERNDKSKKIIICVGKTGHGKSSVVNRLAGDTSEHANRGPCRTSSSTESVTQELQKINVGNLCIIDCPGWADSGGADRRHSNNLCAFLKGCGGINGIVLFRSAKEYRFDADFKQKLEHLSNVFGAKFWDNLIIVLTHVDKGIGEKQFLENKQADKMRQEVVKFSHKNRFYDVIPIGLDNYKDHLDRIRNSIPSHRFICDSIKSPIDELKWNREQFLTCPNGIQDLEKKIDGIDRQINDLEAKIQALQ